MSQNRIFRNQLVQLETQFRLLSRPLRDYLGNRKSADYSAPFLLHRLTLHKAAYIEKFMNWVIRHHPELRSQFHLYATPNFDPKLTSRKVMFNTFNETTLLYHPQYLRAIRKLENACDERGIPVLNRAEALLRVRKSECSKWVERAGVRAPRSELISDVEAFRKNQSGFEFPFLIREELIHGGHSESYLVASRNELPQIPLENMHQPIVTEFIDTSGRNGLYKKYRYFAVGEKGISYKVQCSHSWEVRATTHMPSDDVRKEEFDFLEQQNPFHHEFQEVMKTIGLDYTAIDYSLTNDGQPVIWELNVTPGWGALKSGHPRLREACNEIMMELVCLLHQKAGLENPTNNFNHLHVNA